MHPARKVSFRHLLMDDAAARRHPLNVASRDGTAVAHAIAVLNSSRQDIRDGFDPAMRDGSKSDVLPNPKARRRCTPAPSSVGLNLMSRLTGRMDILVS